MTEWDLRKCWIILNYYKKQLQNIKKCSSDRESIVNYYLLILSDISLRDMSRQTVSHLQTSLDEQWVTYG